MLSYACPQCGVRLQIPEKYLGKSGRCRECGTTFTVRIQETPRPEKPRTAESNGHSGSHPDVRQTPIVAVHLETTGPSTRKCSLIELAAVRMDIDGRELDTFWSFVNPDQPIPAKIVERTGITDGMVAQAPYAIEAVQEFFAWAGSDPILITHHARFQAKFLSASLLNEDIEPPAAAMIDVVDWAADLEVPAPEYKLIPLLLHFQCPVPEGHRALETAQGVRRLFTQLSAMLQKSLTGDSERSGGFLGMLGLSGQSIDTDLVYEHLQRMVSPLERITGADFSARVAYEARKAGGNGNDGTEATRVLQDSKGYHRPEWFEETRHLLESAQRRAPSWTDSGSRVDNASAPWAFVLLEASQCSSPEEERRLLSRAVELGAEDPWPYERLTGFFVQSKDYPAALQVVSKFFDTDAWKQPENSETSLKLLDRMQKLERHLAQRR
jgi:DNA polymerase III epsilon subunit-like protein